jgi:hypothetical protein
MKAIKLEDILEKVIENRYFLFLEKGRHFFDVKCSPKKNIDSIYRKRDWPFIFDIESERIVVPRLTKTDVYPRINLRDPNNKDMFAYMHIVVASTLPNEENKPLINHKNSNTFDYHLSNLERATHSENGIGTNHKKLDYDSLYDFYKFKEDLFE